MIYLVKLQYIFFLTILKEVLSVIKYDEAFEQ